MAIFYSYRTRYAKKESKTVMCYNSLLEIINTREQESSMALFGRKKKDEEQGVNPAENKESNSGTAHRE